MTRKIVLDSCVVSKLFLNEKDSEAAVDLFARATHMDCELYAPNFLYYEVIHVAQYYALPIKQVVTMLNDEISLLLKLIEPTKEHIAKAITIIQMGHTQSGFPSIYDAIFHAMAIVDDATFITADRKHLTKTKHLGNILLLADYTQAFT